MQPFPEPAKIANITSATDQPSDFSGAGFSGAGFSGAGFSGAGFSGAGFSGAGFSGAGFSGADFSGAVLDAVDAAVIVSDLEGRLRYANRAAEALYGRPVDQLVGASAADLMKVTLDPTTTTRIYEALVNGERWEAEYDAQCPDGSAVTIRAVDAGLFDTEGELVAVVSTVTDVSEQRQSVDRLSAEAEVSRFLLDATTALSSTLDFRQSLEELANLAVPGLGDLCLIDVLADGSITRMVVAHAPGIPAELAAELHRAHPPERHGQHPATVAMRTGQAELANDMSDAFLRATSGDDRQYAIVRDLGITAYLSVPLKARGRVLGSVTLASAGTGRRFGDGDRELVEELAQRAALVIDNARLYSERSQVLRSLQAALLPPTLPVVPGMDLAARYRSAGQAADVGGDFYDVFDMGRDTWAAAVGDVSGRGPEAAATTGLVRHALHASVHRERHPAAMLQVANALLCEQVGEDAERFCSVACAVIHPGSPTRVLLSSAGHPPPLLVRAGGALEELDARGPVLGIAPRLTFHSQVVVMNPGDLLLLYTDGLTEARDGRGRFFGEVELAAVAGACRAGGAEAAVGHLLEAVEHFTGGHIADDLALLALGVRLGGALGPGAGAATRSGPDES